MLKADLTRSLGEAFAISPDYERMYAIKIRASSEAIMEDLENFGRPNASFVNLRFLKVRQIAGKPNQIGSVIRYRVPILRLGAEMRLTKKVDCETLFYEVDKRLVEHGRLVFNVAPTRDGNRRLAIYTSFDYKRGKGLASKALWRIARWLFPEFVHDIVWNHALCSIKEEVERNPGPRMPAGRPRELRYQPYH